MEVAALVLSIVAILFTGAALVFTARADRRAVRAEERAEVAEARAVRAEERAEDESATRRRGRPIAVPRGGRGGRGAETVDYYYEVRNAGEAALTAFWLWHQDADGNVVSTRVGGQEVVAPEDDPVRPAAVEVRGNIEEQELWVEWDDADGKHTEDTGYRPPPHM